MKNIKLSLITAALLVSAASYANEQPKAQDLVGKFYGGINTSLIDIDEDRAPNVIDFDFSLGLGLELGYRYSESTEFRLSYNDITIDLANNSTDEDGDAISFDVLYFPTQQNYYVLGGVSSVDIGGSELTANLGLGYRHYFSDRFAAYTEAKTHYSFDESYTDLSAQIGLVYFFGEASKSSVKSVKDEIAPVTKTQAVAAPISAPKAVIKDSDNDGVIDSKDNCASTPVNDKVDSKGCTIFTEEKLSRTLLINFDNNKAVITQKYRSEVAKIANFLNKYSHTSMTIAGHTSSQGAAAYNQKLSQKRADAVVALLVTDFGIEKSRLKAKGYGETLLINTANTAAAHNENRRIEANVSVTQKVRSVR